MKDRSEPGDNTRGQSAAFNYFACAQILFSSIAISSEVLYQVQQELFTTEQTPPCSTRM